jgi:hypothetical protein
MDKPQELFALVLSPTRELAIQIAEQFEALGSGIGLKTAVLVGGIDMMAQVGGRGWGGCEGLRPWSGRLDPPSPRARAGLGGRKSWTASSAAAAGGGCPAPCSRARATELFATPATLHNPPRPSRSRAAPT